MADDADDGPKVTAMSSEPRLRRALDALLSQAGRPRLQRER
jgi:hypothetical protein